MNIISNCYKTPIYKNTATITPSFKGNEIQTLTHTNIGSCLEGYIGKIRVRKGDGSENFLNIFKKRLCDDYENYLAKNDADQVIGEISLAIRRFTTNQCCGFNGNPSHVFVTELRNYSNPTTPYYKNGLEYHKDIGTRLLQIAQRRSDEAQCQGNIKLIAKNESKDWYKKVIGMTEEFPPEQNPRFGFNIHNPNSMILPPHAKEPLSRLQGGL